MPSDIKRARRSHAPTLRSPFGEREHLPWVGTVLRTVRPPIEQAAGSESPPYLETTLSARSADPTQGITTLYSILHTRYSPSLPSALTSSLTSSSSFWPT